jgi:4-carboxymuconolactone decarboxylase
MTEQQNRTDIDDATRETLADIAAGNMDLQTGGRDQRQLTRERSGLDARTFALVRIAALVALDAPPVSYIREVGTAISEGATPEEILEVLLAIAPEVGSPKVTAAAPQIMVGLGLGLPPGPAFDDDDDDEATRRPGQDPGPASRPGTVERQPGPE